MNEAGKSIYQRIKDIRYTTRYFIGDGIDIGAGNDCLENYKEFFPLMNSCRGWDLKDGDAEIMSSIQDNTFDFVHSSHCLEHMRNVNIALTNWLRILKPNGYLICIIPDEDLYEQGIYPSTWNQDHKHTFTIFKQKSWSPVSINLTQLLSNYNVEIKKIELLDATFKYKAPHRIDQSMSVLGECAIEFILKKL